MITSPIISITCLSFHPISLIVAYIQEMWTHFFFFAKTNVTLLQHMQQKTNRNYANQGTYSVISLVPVSSQYGEISCWRRKRHRNHWAASNFESTITPCCLMECKGRKVEVATNLILHLKNISEVLPWWNRTVSTIHSILPWIPPLLHPIPIHKTMTPC